MKTLRVSRFAALLLATFFALSGVPDAAAQNLNPRFGVGANAMLSTPDGLGLGLRGRASAPINSDFSLAVDFGFIGFVLGGRDDANYVVDPQISAIINLPYTNRYANYLLFGLGGYIPVSDTDSKGGPTIHLGAGRIQPLSESSLYYELDPALIIGESKIGLAIPFRVGLIF